MPRVQTQTKLKTGAPRRCGRCDVEILPGEKYYRWSFRNSGTRYACYRHYPRQSELTESKMSQVYAAIESTEGSLPTIDTIEDINGAIQSVAEEVRTVAEEYREAAQAMGGAGAESEEKADTLDSVADELESWEVTVPDEEEFDEDQVGPALSQEMFGIDTPSELDPDQHMEWADRLQEKRDEWDADHDDAPNLGAAREEAAEFLSGLDLP